MVKDFKSYKDLNIIVTATTYSKTFLVLLKIQPLGVWKNSIYGVRAWGYKDTLVSFDNGHQLLVETTGHMTIFFYPPITDASLNLS